MTSDPMTAAKRAVRHAIENAADIIKQLGSNPATTTVSETENADSVLTVGEGASERLYAFRNKEGLEDAWKEAHINGKNAEDVLNDLQAAIGALKDLVEAAEA